MLVLGLPAILQAVLLSVVFSWLYWNIFSVKRPFFRKPRSNLRGMLPFWNSHEEEKVVAFWREELQVSVPGEGSDHLQGTRVLCCLMLKTSQVGPRLCFEGHGDSCLEFKIQILIYWQNNVF